MMYHSTQNRNIVCFSLNTPLVDKYFNLLKPSGYQWLTEGGGFGVFKPPPEIPKALQNRAKLNPIVKTVKNC